jgi:hypothetical protein
MGSHSGGSRLEAARLVRLKTSDRLYITALTQPNSYRKIVGLKSKLKIHGEASSITNRICNLHFANCAEHVEWQQMTGAVIARRFLCTH